MCMSSSYLPVYGCAACPPTQRGNGHSGCHLDVLSLLVLLSGSITLGKEQHWEHWALVRPKAAAWRRCACCAISPLQEEECDKCFLLPQRRMLDTPAEAWEPFGEALPRISATWSWLMPFCFREKGSSSVGWSCCPVNPASEPPGTLWSLHLS